MIFRTLRLLALTMLLALAGVPAMASEVEVGETRIEASEDGYKLNAAFSFELTREMEESLHHSFTLIFTTEVKLTKPRWYWIWDEKTITARDTLSLTYHYITRQYRVKTKGGFIQSFQTLEEALFLIRRPSRWLIAGKGQLKVGDTYNVSVRLFLDPEQLSKPIQVNTINNAGWRFESKYKTFTYKAE